MMRATPSPSGLVLLASVALFGAPACGGSEPAPVAPPAAAGTPAPALPAPSPAEAAPAIGAAPAAPPAAGDAPTPEAVPIPGSELVHGRSSIRVSAPIQRVRDAITDYAH